MPETIIDLGKKVKAKYPGQYDDLDDADVGAKVKAKFPGAYDDFADVSAPQPAAAAPETPITQTSGFQSMLGAGPEEMLNRAKGAGRAVGRTGMGAVQYLQYLMGRKVSPTPLSLEPSPDPNQHIGEMLGHAALVTAPAMATGGASVPLQTAVGSLIGGSEGGIPGAVVGGAIPYAAKSAGALFDKLRSTIPSKAGAGAKFETVMGAAKDVPLDTSAADTAVARAQELRTRGSSMPKVLNDFVKNRKASTGDFMGVPVTEPMTYEVGRDFASNAGALSSREATAMNAKMQRQVAEFANAMKTANREAAVQAGVGDLYDQAMKEYRQAANLQEAAEVVKKWAKRAAIALPASYILSKTPVGKAAAHALQELSGQ